MIGRHSSVSDSFSEFTVDKVLCWENCHTEVVIFLLSSDSSQICPSMHPLFIVLFLPWVSLSPSLVFPALTHLDSASQGQETEQAETELFLEDGRGRNTIYTYTLIYYLSPLCPWVFGGVGERIAEVSWKVFGDKKIDGGKGVLRSMTIGYKKGFFLMFLRNSKIW